MGITTIQVTDETAEALADRKGRGDAYDDVIRRLLAENPEDPAEAPLDN